MDTRTARLLLLTGSLIAALVGAEAAYRAALFSSDERLLPLKDPRLYADAFSEDLYWKLQVTFSNEFPPPKRPHPVLGWVGNFSRETLRHRDTRNLAGRRPVLLFGDSFAACFGDVACFEDILNTDDQFASDNYLVNYGVGGYGLDQTHLLLLRTIDHFDRPFVVFSLFTYDIDRCLLSFRIGQKPRFTVANDSLELDPVLIYGHTNEYLAAHPPRAVSYLYRRALFSGLLPEGLTSALRRAGETRRLKLELGEQILSATLSELKSRDLDFVFLVFHGHRPTDNSLFGGTDWREQFLLDWLARNNVPHIWTKDVVAADLEPLQPPDATRYLDPTTLHPTERLNRLLASEISSRVQRTHVPAPLEYGARYRLDR